MCSFAIPEKMQNAALIESSCGYLLQELQLIWDEVGQDQLEKEKVLLEIEQECIAVYRRKVDTANISRARLHQLLVDSEAQFTHLLISLGERTFPSRPEKMAGTLKEQLDSITPALQEMQQRKEERVCQFQEVQMQIRRISAEIAGNPELMISPTDVTVNENDLSLKKLGEYRLELQQLHKEKSDRLQKVDEYIQAVHILAATLGIDSSTIIAEVHPSLDFSSGQQSKNISNAILDRLNSTVASLEQEKQKRMDKLHKLGRALTNLWNLMDTSSEDRRLFAHVTGLISASAADISNPGSLALKIIHQAEVEVDRLDQLKASKIKELFLKKQLELEDICKGSHMEILQSEMDSIMKLINSGEIDHADLLASMDEQICRAKEEASSRKTIMEKVEKWMSYRVEERWLEEYSRDKNRYTVSRGAHKNLKRAERARITVNKIPALVDLLIAKTKGWEEERRKVFFYDEVPLLAILDEYNLLRKEKEEEKQRQRDNKKVQGQVAAGQENLFGSRPGISNRCISDRSLNWSFGSTTAVPLNRRLSMMIRHVESNGIGSTTQKRFFIKEGKKEERQKILKYSGYASCLREDIASQVSASF